MAFWWVNHKQTFRAEIEEGYIWSPQTNKNNSKNQTYLNLKATQIHDVVFSYAFGKISAIGVVEKTAMNSPRPVAFGKAGEQWANDGWLVYVKWEWLQAPISPKNYINNIAPLLPKLNSPIQQNGNGNQSCYLAGISDELGHYLLSLIEKQDDALQLKLSDIDESIEEQNVVDAILKQPIQETYKEQLVKARVGQGTFRLRVEEIEKGCRLTGITDRRFLIASHIKPWRDSSNEEKLDGHNGLLLSPHVDKLFDKGCISFSDTGAVLIADDNILNVTKLWKLNLDKEVGAFTTKQRQYLRYHRENIFRNQSRLNSLLLIHN